MGSSIFERPLDQTREVACTITSLAPLTVTIGTTTGILAKPATGVTYSLGPATAITQRVGRPRIY